MACDRPLPGLSLYIHIPFCRSKCPYCDFASRAVATVPAERYLAALLLELAHKRAALSQDPRPLHSLYIGGGTPTILPAGILAAVVRGVQDLWPLTADGEITVEANPGSLDAHGLAILRQAGVNRVSLGAQAMDDQRLALLGRSHDKRAILAAVTAIRAAGFDDFSLDLIHSTPRQRPADWWRELNEVLALAPPHLSCYALTIEAGTPFHQRFPANAPPLPDEDTALALFLGTRARLREAGYDPYEISNFARPGHHCRHNLHYWRFGDYLGIGAAAHGKLTDHAGQIFRQENPTDAEQYMEQAENNALPPLPGLSLSRRDAASERIIMGLRTRFGVDVAGYFHTRAFPIHAEHGTMIDNLVAAGYLERSASTLTLTEEGIPLADAVMAAFL